MKHQTKPLTVGDLVQDFTLTRGSGQAPSLLTAEQRELNAELRAQMPSPGAGTIFRWNSETRDSTTLTALGGTGLQYGGTTIANLVPEIGVSVINSMPLVQLGARVLTGLRANLSLPYGTAQQAAQWKVEAAAADEQGEVFGTPTLAPKRVTVCVPVTRDLIDQGSPAINAFVNTEISRTIASAIELAAIQGDGNEPNPLGLIYTTGIGSVIGGTNGAAPDYGDLVDLEAAVKTSGGKFGFLVSRRARKKLRKTFVNGTGSAPIWLPNESNRLLGHPAAASDICPDNLTKGSSSGVCSALVFADWSELFVALYGPGISIEIVQDSAFAKAGKVMVVGIAYVDAAYRNPVCAAAMLDALCL
jgi:HK97 family phage major capsid protein